MLKSVNLHTDYMDSLSSCNSSIFFFLVLYFEMYFFLIIIFFFLPVSTDFFYVLKIQASLFIRAAAKRYLESYEKSRVNYVLFCHCVYDQMRHVNIKHVMPE